MARAAQLGMVMQETETTEQGDTEQDPDGHGHRSEDGGCDRADGIRTVGRTDRGRRDRAEYGNCSLRTWHLRRREDSANTDEETQAQQEAAGAENPSGVYRLVIQKGMSAVLSARSWRRTESFPMRRRSGSIYRRSDYASNMRVGNYDILTVCRMRKLQKILQAGPLEK